MRLSALVLLTAQGEDKIRVKRKDTGKVTHISPETLEKNPQLYHAPDSVKPSKKQRRKELAQEEKRRREEQDTSDEGQQEQKLTDEQQRKKDAIEWYLYDFEGEERPETPEPEKPKPEKGKKPKLTLKDIKDLVEPDKKSGECPEGFQPKTFVHKGLKQKFTRCVPVEEKAP
jgi:hypothetical protein